MVRRAPHPELLLNSHTSSGKWASISNQQDLTKDFEEKAQQQEMSLGRLHLKSVMVLLNEYQNPDRKLFSS
jgi:hypothetical protein